MIYFYCTSWQFFQMIVKWRISPTTEQIMFTFSILLFHFYSHIPCGMWRIPKLKHFVLLRFLLTHPVWDVTNWSGDFNVETDISTHTSRVGCDSRTRNCQHTRHISTHTSRVGCDGEYATEVSDASISTHTSRVGCDILLFCKDPIFRISTHTSRVGCDFSACFLLLLPYISTHTSRVGCDLPARSGSCFLPYFYSHIPCGMWPFSSKTALLAFNFYSHIPCGMWQTKWDAHRLLANFYSHIPCGMWQIAI